MKRTTKTLIAASMLAAAGTLALTGASFAGKGGYDRGDECGAGYGKHGKHGKKHHARGPHGMHGMMLIETFDTDQDGKVTQAEVDSGRAQRVVEFDTDKDGNLTINEYEVLWLDAMRERMVDRFQDLDADGDGIVTVEEFSAPMAKIVAHEDRDGDGALSQDDMKKGKKGGHRKHDDDSAAPATDGGAAEGNEQN